ncbi:MAG TPA: rhomboid family intramembrane serine protease [Thermomicrobiales bacterium]|nr:rhomboid family intramembrane serine protease [Thermomicrobiales bacterium]
MIPIGDDDTGIRRVHLIVILLLLANIGTFIYQLTLDQAELTRFVHAYGVVPYEITRLEDIPPLIDFPVLITLITSMFLHGGFLHIGGNMLFLWIFGDNIEDVMGHGRFLIFYLLCGIVAGLAQVMIDRDSMVPIIGASGAISGVMGAYLMLFPRGMVRVATLFVFIPIIFRMPAVIVIGFWFLIQAMSGYASLLTLDQQVEGGTAFFAHIGGFIAGMFLVWLFADRRAVRYQNLRRRGSMF